MRMHTLKTHPEAFAAIVRGEKNFEFRLNDRDFVKGDKAILQEWDPVTGGRVDSPAVVADVGFVLHGPAFGVPAGYCVFSLLNAATEAGLIRSPSLSGRVGDRG